ncbi:MAG: BrnT family toxin [Chromatiales bacterium]|nr:BrnT family toxin [Chromatiales bacterium]
MNFEWEPEKEQSNQRKHGVSFLEASTVFADPMELTIYDPDHSEGEHRFLSVDQSSSGRMLVVSYTEREENRIRIINARPATAIERKRYESES